MTKALGKEGSFAEGPSNSPRQRFFLKILKISLLRALAIALVICLFGAVCLSQLIPLFLGYQKPWKNSRQQ